MNSESVYTSSKTQASKFASLLRKINGVQNVKQDLSRENEYYISFDYIDESAEEIASMVKANNLLTLNFYGANKISSFFIQK